MFLSENNPDIIIKIPYFWAQAAKRSVGIILRAHAFGPLADDIARARCFVSRKILPMYSPMTPMSSGWAFSASVPSAP